MTRKESLADLIAKVAAGKWDRQYPKKGMAGLRSAERLRNARRGYNGSLDAARALHEAVLLDWEWGCGFDGDGGFGAGVSRDSAEFVVHGGAHSPARAWLLAILRALHSMEPDT